MLCGSLFSLAEENVNIYTHFTSANGLSCNYIHDIGEDEDGFIWIATESGLNRFDGEQFKHYSNENYPSLFGDVFYHVYRLPNNKMAFAGANGILICYNRNADAFDDLSIRSDKQSKFKGVTGFSTLADGSNAVSTNWGAYRYNCTENRYSPLNGHLAEGSILELFQHPAGTYWLGQPSGACLFSPSYGPLKTPLQTIDNAINNILMVDEQHILLSSTVGDLWMATANKGGIPTRVDKISLPFHNISTLLKDRMGNIWFGTLGNGVWKATYTNGRFKYAQMRPNNTNGDSITKVTSLFEDSRGIVWIGTQNTGLWCKYPAENESVIHSLFLGYPNMVCTSFAETDNGNLVACTDGSGCYLMDANFNVKRHLTAKDGLSRNNVIAISKGDGHFTCCFWGGELTRFSTDGSKVEKIPFNGLNDPVYTNKSICQSADGTWWCGTSGDGVYACSNGLWSRVKLANSELMGDYPDIWINEVCPSRNGDVWILTSRTIWHRKNGVFVPVMPDGDKIATHTPLRYNSAAFDADNNLIVATSNGLLFCKADGSQPSPVSFVPKRPYAGILCDSKGLVWVSGTNGISCIDFKNKKIVSNYNVCYNGNSDVFTPHAAFNTSNGRLLFGSQDGFVVIDPQKGQKEADNLKILWDNLFINNERQCLGNGVLSAPLGSEKLVLDYNQTNMAVSFSILDFHLHHNLVAQYRIVGLDTCWTDLNANRMIKIAHLEKGTYQLEIRVIKNGMSSGVISTVLEIGVLPPWWATWWFKLLVGLAVMLLAGLIVYGRFRQIERQKQQLEVIVNERTNDLNLANQTLQNQKKDIERKNKDLLSTLQSRDQLVTVVAHDLKNPMFAIVGALEHLVKQPNKQEKNRQELTEVYKEASTLQGEMLKLLDWATSNQNELVCRMEEVDLLQLVTDTIHLLKGLTTAKCIDITVDNQLQKTAFADARMVSTISRNLLTNAIKFTPKGAQIGIHLYAKEGYACLAVQDSGVGMTPETLAQLQKGDSVTSANGTDNENGFGLGLQLVKRFVAQNNGRISIDSQLGHGSTIEVMLPQGSTNLPLVGSVAKVQEPEVQLSLNEALLKGCTILVVDDDALILNNIGNILSPHAQVLLAHDGKEGLAIARKELPDLIISDVDMPELDGLQFYAALQQQQVTSNIPLVFLSMKVAVQDRLQGLNIGAIDYIAKPFEANELLLKVNNIMVWQRRQQMQLLANSLKGTETATDTSINPVLKQLLDVVKANYTNPDFSFDDMATQMAMSKSTLSRKMKAITDKSPVEILSEYRLNMARLKLKEGTLSVADVAYSVGFNDPLYFSRKFKDVFGFPPSKQG